MEPYTYALDTTWRTLLKDVGVKPANALRRAGLPEDLLQQSSVRLGVIDYYRLWDSIVAEHGDPLFPIRLCQAIRSESFIPPLFAALCSPNLSTAAQRISRYKKLIGPVHMRVQEAHDSLAIEFSWHAGPPPPVSLVAMELLFCVALARMGTREHICPVEVRTTVLPEPLPPYADFLGIPLRRGPRHCIRFARVDALQPFLTSNETLWNTFEPALRQRLADLDHAASTTGRVRAALHESIPGGVASMDAIAGKLAMSKRTLQRRIDIEGTNFQQILQETREALARHYLQNTTLPSTEIAFLLGYDEPNSFYRAFRHWTGTTPDSVRAGAC